MMRLRMSSGFSNSDQFRTIASITETHGPGFVDLTTRQQIQLRGFGIENVQNIWNLLEEVGLNSLQTGFDNIRGVTGCPVSGLTPNELFDASPVAKGSCTGLFSFRLFVHFIQKVTIRRSLGQGKVLD